MNIYLAARYGAKDQVEELAQYLRKRGFAITSTWHNPDKEATPYGKVTAALLRREAQADRKDLEESDTIVSCEIFGDKGSRGARHCEFGHLMCRSGNLVLFGKPWQCFHFLPEVKIVSSKVGLVRVLNKLKNSEVSEEDLGGEFQWTVIKNAELH